MATVKERSSLYGDSVNIDFYPNSHRYKKEGEKGYLISVTAAVGIIDKSRFLIPWALRLAKEYMLNDLKEVGTISEQTIDEAIIQHRLKKERAGDIGSEVHGFAESVAQASMSDSDLPAIPENQPPEVIQGIIAFLDWHNRHDIYFKETERMVYSKKHDYVGLLDLIAIIDKKKYLVDYKTSKGIYSDAYFQVAAYRNAYEEETGEKLDGTLILHFNKENGEFAIHERPEEDYQKDLSAFLGALAVKKRKKELKEY